MAQLGDLIVSGKSRFLNTINTSEIDLTTDSTHHGSITPTKIKYQDGTYNQTELTGNKLKIETNQNSTTVTPSTLEISSSTKKLTIVANDITKTNDTWDGTNTSLTTAVTNAKGTVLQSPSTTNSNYEILFSNTANNNELTEATKKSSTLLFNPAQKALTGGTRKANTTVGEYSFSVGISNTASGYCCQAFGNEVSATNNNTFAHGYQTVASHYCAHAEGWQTTASGQSSHAEGEGTIANHRNQHVFGRFNVADPSTAVADADGTYVEIVGNGGGSGSKSNARTLDWSGNETLAGSLQLGGGLCQLSNLGNIELKPGASNANHGGYIDFHYNQSTADYTARLIESGSSGTLKAYNSISNASDRRLKDNIVNIDNKYIYLLNELDAKQYNFKSSPDKVELGFIAQEVESAMKIIGIKDDEMPIISKPTDDELDKYYGLDYSQMTALLWKICQEQQKEIDELKVQLNK